MDTTLNTRLQTLRSQVMKRKGSFIPPERRNPFTLDVALWRAAEPNQSVVQRRARLLREQVRIAPLALPRGWRLAGEHLPRASEGFGFASGPEPDTGCLADAYDLDDAQIAAVRETVYDWIGKGRSDEAGRTYYATGIPADGSTDARGRWNPNTTDYVFWAGGWVENHSVRDYAKVLDIGFEGIRQEIEEQLQTLDIADAEYPQAESFLRAGLDVCDAGIMLGNRYAGYAARAARRSRSATRRTELEHMAEACSRVPRDGARTLAEAVQSLWLAHVLTCGEDGINANSIGRLDQLLNPFYQADLDAGRITRKEAVEWMEELACKLYLDYDVQAIVLGGLTREGTCAVNDMTYIILEASEHLEFVRDLSVRLDRQSPPELVTACARQIAKGGGIPFLFNDDCFVPALTSHGIAQEDARDYAPIGCVELTIPGRANPHAVSGWFNALKCLELALFDGADPRTGRQLGPRTGRLDTMTRYEDLWTAYCAQVDFFARRMVYFCNRGELEQREKGPLPLWSVLTDDCISRGRDITDGGAVYNYHSICFLGTADTADALMAVKELVFEKKQVTAQKLLDALCNDFHNTESLRQMLVNKAPKYGNDNDRVDAIARVIDDHFIGLMDTFRTPLGGRYFVHLFSFLCNIAFGKATGATPDGRRAGEPLAYSLSAHQGRDIEGVTAMLRSLAKLPHDRAAGASAAIIDLDPKVIEGDGGIQRLASLIRAAVDMGVGQLQWNVTTIERLRQAQQDPEHYGNIAVRVAGYSQMFRLIPPELQEHIIARTKHTH